MIWSWIIIRSWSQMGMRSKKEMLGFLPACQEDLYDYSARNGPGMVAIIESKPGGDLHDIRNRKSNGKLHR